MFQRDLKQYLTKHKVAQRQRAFPQDLIEQTQNPIAQPQIPFVQPQDPIAYTQVFIAQPQILTVHSQDSLAQSQAPLTQPQDQILQQEAQDGFLGENIAHPEITKQNLEDLAENQGNADEQVQLLKQAQDEQSESEDEPEPGEENEGEKKPVIIGKRNFKGDGQIPSMQNIDTGQG